MCQKNTESPDAKAKQPSEGAEAQGHEGCPCEPKRCLPFAGAVLAAVAVPLVIRAMKRSRRNKGKGACTHKAAGCCA